jgi:hypothetical protein
VKFKLSSLNKINSSRFISALHAGVPSAAAAVVQLKRYFLNSGIRY